jgi:glycosyltransferase involved in cell wall biosynthesis
MTNKTVLIIIPALNEGPHIAGVIAAIPKEIRVKDQTFATAVAVIDDGSHDNTAAEAGKAGATVLRHVVNTGAGGATRTGLRYAETLGDDITYVVTIDGDGQHASRDIQRLVEYAAQHNSEMIVGNRLHAANKQRMPLHRRVINWGGSLFSRILFGIKTKDTQSGLRLYSAATIPKISYFTLDRYGFCTETLWYAVRHRVRVDEIPITVSYSKESMARGQSVWASLEILRDLIRVRIAG